VGGWIGRSLERVEDAALLRGAGRFADDLPTPAGTLHAAFVRSPLAHARVLSVDTERARALPGVAAVVTGEEAARHTLPLLTAVRVDAPQHALATDRVRYTGEPVAIVLARDRYVAEDALDLVDVRYEPLPALVDPRAAAAPGAGRLHAGTDGNVLHERRFEYGEVEAAFAGAEHVVETTVSYPRNSCTPIECLCVIAHHEPAADAYDVQANFQGPYSLHPVMARSLKVPGNRLRLRTPPDSGGSYGVKQAVFPYVVALSVAAKLARRPVKWLEDRLEHLCAATSSTNRVTTVRAAVDGSGRVLALDYDQLEDCGAYLRAPEPATLYRMHGNMTGAYAVECLRIRNRVVVTNKTPTGLMRGFGGPQVYFALERLMDRIAATLGVDPLELRRRNLVPAEAMPWRTASGAVLDSGDYRASVERAVCDGGLAALLARRDAARAQGRLYGVGYAAVIEPSISNMGYITTLLTPGQRERAGPKNGALATATVGFDPSGAVTVSTASVPQGQGHRTVLAQVVADALGLAPEDVVVTTEHDTAKDAWSIASGNYSSRFAGAVAGAAHQAATRLRERLACIAAAELNVPAEEVELAAGEARARANPENAIAIGRAAARAHWSPLSIPGDAGAGLRETAVWSMPELTEPDASDRVNSSGTHGFLFDFCGVDVDPDTFAVRVDRYVTLHDAGTLLNPMLADGQIRGGFAHGLGAALLEELAYAPDGGFLSGTLADYTPPTACEVPDIDILHDHSPSPLTPLGAKGVGEGNCMSTPVCVANAVADAIGCEVNTLPLTPARIAGMLLGAEPPGPGPSPEAAPEPASEPPGAAADAGRALRGAGAAMVPAPPERVWAVMLDERELAAVIPGCHALERTGEDAYEGEVTLGVGPVQGRFRAGVALSDLDPPRSLRMRGSTAGPLGASEFDARVTLAPVAGGTRIDYAWTMRVSGKVAAVGARMLDGAARALIDQLFRRLAARSGGEAQRPAASGGLPARLRARLRALLGSGR